MLVPRVGNEIVRRLSLLFAFYYKPLIFSSVSIIGLIIISAFIHFISSNFAPIERERTRRRQRERERARGNEEIFLIYIICIYFLTHSLTLTIIMMTCQTAVTIYLRSQPDRHTHTRAQRAIEMNRNMSSCNEKQKPKK